MECADQQKCLPHLLHVIGKIEEHSTSELDWKPFARLAVGIYRDAKKLHGQKGKLDSNNDDMGVTKLEGRLPEISHTAWQQLDAQRLAKQIEKYGKELQTILWYDDVPMDNNTVKQAIRPQS